MSQLQLPGNVLASSAGRSARRRTSAAWARSLGSSCANTNYGAPSLYVCGFSTQ
jgi:hypothetical protein